MVAVLAILLVFPLVGSAKKKDEYAATPNPSFPIIATDIIQMFYLQTWVDDDGDGVIDGSEWYLDDDLDDDGIHEMTEPRQRAEFQPLLTL